MSYLDTNKSIMISSPAGSGKTEKLARRYIALLQDGVDVERILAITFTEKASAEMKQRILRILKTEDEKLFRYLIDRIPLMRVSTIHSFCGTLLRRFSFDAGIDPNYGIADDSDSAMEWDEVLHDVLMDVGANGRSPVHKEDNFILQTLSEKGFRGLDYLRGTMDYLFQKRPFSLEARPFTYVSPVSGELIEELRSWEGAADAVDNYEKIFAECAPKEIISIEDCFLTKDGTPRKKTPAGLKGIRGYQEWAVKMHLYWKDVMLVEFAERSGRIWKIFNTCLGKYLARKKAKGVLDFSDLEYLAYRMLTDNPEWANILYAFDEKTDHILVDEFQDTNNFQWEVINKLTEEWRSGMGAKREGGTRPTIFFVGDEKQSIYFFRGANVEIFRRAKQQMETWLGDEFLYEEAKENYRSRPAIIEFTNQVFSKIMRLPERYPWITRYTPFNAQRPGLPHPGRVELVLLQPDEDAGMDERKQKEAGVIARRIKSLAGNLELADRGSEQKRSCRYSDIAILLKKRTHLAPYEEALRKYNIPFVAVKGIGFYQETEIAMLRALVFFLSDPHDDYSLYTLLKSPLFNIAESDILQLTGREGESLFEKMRGILLKNPPIPNFAEGGTSSPLERGAGVCNGGALIPPLKKGDEGGFFEPIGSAVIFLQNWLAQSAYLPLAELLEHALVSTKAWRYFHEEQKRANIKKFIRIVEDLEAKGKSLIRVRDFLERTADEQEAKANVNTEGMDAVKIMTIHAAKGLEFPVVFVPGIEERFTPKTGDNLIYELTPPSPPLNLRGGQGELPSFCFKSIPEPSIRKQDDDYLVHEAKEMEEQKRLFYVAVTRAEEALILTGHWGGGDNSFLGFLVEGLGLQERDGTIVTDSDIKGLAMLTEEDIEMLYDYAYKKEEAPADRRRVEVIPLSMPTRSPWKSVTEAVEVRRRHGEGWMVLGDIIHRVFEGISKGMFQEHDIPLRAKMMLESKGIHGAQAEEKLSIIGKDISTLKGKGVWQEIIMPAENSFTELPFVLEAGEKVYNGRIDRVIKENDVYKIFDYKTFPVKEEEVGYLLKEYSFQMNTYKKAVKELFNTNSVKSFIVFTHTGGIYEV